MYCPRSLDGVAQGDAVDVCAANRLLLRQAYGVAKIDPPPLSLRLICSRARGVVFDPDEMGAAVEAQRIQVEHAAHAAERQPLLMPVALNILALMRE
ncbi:MAG: hypothetical protein U0587_04635 [Candidatus Binatia bacterium]